MNSWKFKKQCQNDFDNGISRSSIFEKYSESGVSEKKLAYAVSTTKDVNLVKKYRLLNYLVVGFMILLGVATTLSSLEIFTSGETVATVLVASILILFFGLTYGISRNYHQAYLVYALLITMKLPSYIVGFGSDLLVNIIELGLALFLVISLWFLKAKLYPYMGIFGAPKKVADGKYLVAVDS